MQPVPYDVSGAVFTGHTQQQSYQITTKYLIEKIPSVADSNLVVLTQPATPHDPVALEMYARATSILPGACPVDMNPFGEWFETLMDVLGQVAPALGGALTPLIPIAGAVGTGLGQLATGAANRNRQERNPGKGKSPPKGGVNTGKKKKGKNLQPVESVTVTRKKKNNKANVQDLTKALAKFR
jgi:hypothetical protein